MHPAPGEALQRVCPHCSTVAYTAEKRCPWCGGGYARRIWPALLIAAILQTAVLLGIAAALAAPVSDEVDQRLDEKIRAVQSDLDDSFGSIRRDVRAELDRRLPALPTPTP
jgi:RNA polymerase subunit RPABC4/transcription elongation factor Spt4